MSGPCLALSSQWDSHSSHAQPPLWLALLILASLMALIGPHAYVVSQTN